MTLDTRNGPEGIELNHWGEDLEGVGPQHETLLVYITFTAINFFFFLNSAISSAHI